MIWLQTISGVFVLAGAGITGYFTFRVAKRAGVATEAAAKIQAKTSREGTFMDSLIRRLDQAEEEMRLCRQENSSLRKQLDDQHDELRAQRVVLDDLSFKQRQDAHLITLLRAYCVNLRAFIVGLGQPVPSVPFGLDLEEQSALPESDDNPD